MFKGYEAGMRSGAIEWAIADAGVYLLCSFMSGVKLDIFESESWIFIQEMKLYKNRVHRPMVEMYLQCALNLMGKNKEMGSLSMCVKR